MKFSTRAYNSFQINPITKSSIIKTSDEIRLKQEAEYYLNIPKEMKIFFPRLLDYKLTPPYSIELEYYAYSNLGVIMINEPFKKMFWQNIFESLINYINCYKKSEAIISNRDDSLLMLINKTEDEYSKLMNEFIFFREIKDVNEFIFNGKKLKSFNLIWGKIKSFIKKKNS